MNDPKKRLLIRLYFTSLRFKPALILLGVGLLLAWSRPGLWIMGAGALYMGTLITAVIVRPSDGTIDRWLREDVTRLRQKAYEMLDIEDADIESDELLQLAGPLTHTTPLIKKEDIRFRRGRDRFYRISANKVLILCPTRHYLGVFQCIYDSIRDEIFHSVATEYAYRNVVAVRRGENAEVFKGEETNKLTDRSGRAIVPTQFFSMSISNGETFTVPVLARVSERRSPGGRPMTDLDRVVAALKKLLHDKHMAA